MSPLSLFLICLIVGIFLWKILAKSQRQSGLHRDNGTRDNRATSTSGTASIENVGPGTVLELRNIGPQMQQLKVQVTARHTYRQNGYKWYELECERSKGKLWIEIERSNSLEISVGLQELKLSDIGLTPDDLDRMRSNDEGFFTYQGATFEFEEGGRAVFYRNSVDQDAENFTFWDFESDDTDNCISVERWSDGSHNVSVSQPVRSSQITVISSA